MLHSRIGVFRVICSICFKPHITFCLQAEMFDFGLVNPVSCKIKKKFNKFEYFARSHICTMCVNVYLTFLYSESVIVLRIKCEVKFIILTPFFVSTNMKSSTEALVITLELYFLIKLLLLSSPFCSPTLIWSNFWNISSHRRHKCPFSVPQSVVLMAFLWNLYQERPSAALLKDKEQDNRFQ